MKISGIICEYNPMHNGHIHHIAETRKNKATHIVGIMSGNFVQRGDVALMDKLERARIAVKSGVDLVIELPVPYCLSSAENYARGAIYLLSALGVVDEVSFGSECGDVAMLKDAADKIDYCVKNCSDEIKKLTDMGYTYPKALSSVVRRDSIEADNIISKPNNVLAVEYIRAMKKYNTPVMRPFTVKREAVQHDGDDVTEKFASASKIREQILGGNTNVMSYMPETSYGALTRAYSNGEIGDIKRLERVILYMLRVTTPEFLAGLNDITQGLEHLIHGARMSDSLDDLFNAIKHKNFTMSRLRRVLLSALIGIKKTDIQHNPPYGRILAMNARGTDILAKAKGYTMIPFDTSLAKLGNTGDIPARFAKLEGIASDVYGLSLNKIGSAKKDYHSKFTIDID